MFSTKHLLQPFKYVMTQGSQSMKLPTAKKKKEAWSQVCYYFIPLSISHSHEWRLRSRSVVEYRAQTRRSMDECWLTV